MGVGGGSVGAAGVRVGIGVKVASTLTAGAVAEMGGSTGGFSGVTPDKLHASALIKRTTNKNRLFVFIITPANSEIDFLFLRHIQPTPRV